MSTPDKNRRRLKDLRVADLKHELDSRKLDCGGNKAVLIQRLEQALSNEGIDVHDHWFHCGANEEAKEDLSGQPVTDLHESAGDAQVEQNRNLHEQEDNDGRDEQQHDNLEVRTAGDLLVHDDYEESDLLADNGGRRNHARNNAISPANAVGGPSEIAQTMSSNDGNEDEDHTRMAHEDELEQPPHDPNEDEEGENELNRSHDYLKSGRMPVESEEEKASSRNLWVSNLSSQVKATELKTTFMRFGEVEGAKIVVSSKTPDSPFGFVTMASIEAADECVKAMDGTEWEEKIVKVEKIARDPTSSTGVNGNDSRARRNASAGSRRSGDGSRRLSASDRRRLSAKADDSKSRDSTGDGAGDDDDAMKSGDGTSERATKERDPAEELDFYKRKARRNNDYIRELEGTVERNRRRHNFQLQREREKVARAEQQCRKEISSLRRERDMLSNERDLLDKRRSDIDRLERMLSDREKMLRDRERHVEDKEREYISMMQRNRQPTTLSSSTYGSSQQHQGRYYASPPASSSSKRPYQSVDVDTSHGSSWGPSGGAKRGAGRSDYNDDRNDRGRGNASSSVQQGYASSYRSGAGGATGGRGGREYDDRGSYGAGGAGGYGGAGNRGGGGASAGAAGRWGQSSGGVSSAGGSGSNSVAHWVKPVNHRPPFVGGSGGADDGGAGESWSRGGMSNMQGTTRRF